MDDEDLGNDELINLTNRRRAENVAPTNQNQQTRGRGHQQPVVQFVPDNDDVDLDGAGATGAIVPPPLAPRVMFNISSTMIQLIKLKGYPEMILICIW